MVVINGVGDTVADSSFATCDRVWACSYSQVNGLYGSSSPLIYRTYDACDCNATLAQEYTQGYDFILGSAAIEWSWILLITATNLSVLQF